MIVDRIFDWIEHELKAPAHRALTAPATPPTPQLSEAEQQTHALLQGMRERGLTDVSIVEELEALHREVKQSARLQGLPTEHAYAPASLVDVYA